MSGSASDPHEKPPYIRVATPADLDELSIMNQRAFISSPAQTYFAGVSSPLTFDASDAKRRSNQTNFIKFLIRRSWSMGARITVVVVPNTDGKDRIVACAICKPPGGRPPSLLQAFRMGLLSVFAGWGLGVMTRISTLVEASKTSLDEGYAKMKLPGSPSDAWYLQLAGVDPEFQSKGYMSKLLKEAFQHSPGSVFTLEATTLHARDIYQHCGFQVVKEVIVAKGKVDALGVVAAGNAATGFPIYPMIRASN